ncbi:MAG: hypothetical protein ACAI44_07040 [Candidatus Sericytochromatia bacterium]
MRILMMLLALLPLNQELPVQDRPLWRQRLQWPDSYEQRWLSSHPDAKTAGLNIYALSGPLYLIRVETFGDAEAPGQIFYVYDERSQTGILLTLAWLSRPPGGRLQAMQAQELAGLTEFEPQAQILRLLARKDCGELIRWRFHLGRPLLKEVRTQNCSAAAATEPDPEKWPRSWP